MKQTFRSLAVSTSFLSLATFPAVADGLRTPTLAPNGNAQGLVLPPAANAPTGLLARIAAMGGFQPGGFVPNVVGKVYAASKLTDLTCTTDQTANLNAASFAAGNGGDVELPAGCILLATLGGVQMLPGQHWHGAGKGFETSDPFFSPLLANGSPNYAGEAANVSKSGTHFKYDQVSGSAIGLAGDGATIDHAWLTNAAGTASFTGSISVANGVATLSVASTGVTGTIVPGQVLSGAGVVPDMIIGAGGTGTGGAGTYPLTSVAGPVAVVAQATVSAEGMTAAPSAIALQLGEKQEPDGSTAVDAASQALDSIRTEGFGTAIDVQSGTFWHISHFDVHGAAQYGIRVRNFNYPDSGDGAIETGTIYSSGIDGIRYEFGGGLKVGFTKILGGPHAFELAVPDSLTLTARGSSTPTVIPINTSDLFIPLGNSFENQTAGTVVLGCNGPNGVANPNGVAGKPTGGVFNGSLFDMQEAAPPGTAALATTGVIVNGCVQGVDIEGGYGGFAGAINILGGSYITAHPRGIGGSLGYGVSIADGVVGVSVPYLPPVTFNKAMGSGYYNLIDNRSQPDGITDRQDVRVVDVPQSATATALYAIGIQPFTGARVTVEVEGIISNVGAVNTISDVLLTNTGGGVVAPTVLPTSVNAASSITVSYAISGSTVSIGLIANNGGNASDFTGTFSIKVGGHTSSYLKL